VFLHFGKAETAISKGMLLSSTMLDFWSWCQWLFSATVG